MKCDGVRREEMRMRPNMGGDRGPREGGGLRPGGDCTGPLMLNVKVTQIVSNQRHRHMDYHGNMEPGGQ